MTGVINSLEDLRPGDLGFGPIGGLAGIIPWLGQLWLGEGFHVGDLNIEHVLVVTQAGSLEPAMFGDGIARVLPKAVQAMPRGAEEIHLHPAKHWTREWAFVRIPEDYPGQALDAAYLARLMIGTPYSPLSYGALAAWRRGLKAKRLEGWIDRRHEPFEVTWPSGIGPTLPTGERVTSVRLPWEAICSVLGDQVWSLTGKKIMRNVPHQCVTPGALAGRLWFNMPGAIWGGAAWYLEAERGGRP